MFERAFVLNMASRPERLAQFTAGLPDDLPFPQPDRFLAINGHTCGVPASWDQTPGAWGCLQSHLAILEMCLAERIKSALIFEDDALFVPGFSNHCRTFFAAVPDDWEMLYLGGSCRKFLPSQSPPQIVNEHVVRCPSLTGTWAFGYRGAEFMRRLRDDLLERLDSPQRHHVDIMLCHLHDRYRVYAPSRWLVNHAAGVSDVRSTSKVRPQLVRPDPVTLAI
jgi:hypothetical protein